MLISAKKQLGAGVPKFEKSRNIPELRIGGNEASGRDADHEIGFGGTFKNSFFQSAFVLEVFPQGRRR